MYKKIILIALLLSFGCVSKEVKPVKKKPKPRPVKEVVVPAETKEVVVNVNSIEKLKSNPELYTLYNIHVDHTQNRIFTVNYQLPGIVIPICTKVAIEGYNNSTLKFKTLPDNKNYVYLSHRAIKDKLSDHITKVFGDECNRKEMAALSGIDKEGITKAEALPGMTKKGVLYAIGNPPSNLNKDIENSKEWTYWKNRWIKFTVIFNDRGIVESIKTQK